METTIPIAGNQNKAASSYNVIEGDSLSRKGVNQTAIKFGSDTNLATDFNFFKSAGDKTKQDMAKTSNRNFPQIMQ